MPDPSMFLDTCALLYLASGSDRLSSHARSLIDVAAVVFVSPITAWEISLKCLRSRLTLPETPEAWFAGALIHHRLELYQLSPEVLMAANRLPWHHRDPADRFIVSSALAAKATLVTTDEKLRAYGLRTVC